MTTGGRPPAALLAETLVALVISSLAIRLMSFPRLLRLARKQRSANRVAPLEFTHMLRRSIDAWSLRLPWRTLCFEQGLSAHWILGRHGFSSTLHYGAAHLEGELAAHVWVKSRDLDVIGCENASDFAILSQISNDSSSPAVQP